MRLRNKKTGEIGVINLKVYGNDKNYVFDKLETLYEDWEDNVPKEPLIKDDGIRKAVRAWAEANDFDKVDVDYDLDSAIFRFSNGMIDVCFIGLLDLKYGTYTITDLCGLEE